jgi:hypothetical protein
VGRPEGSSSPQVQLQRRNQAKTHTQIGLVAQEVELVSPGLVSESPDRDEDGNDLGTVTKSVELLGALHEGSQGAAGSNGAHRNP